MFLATSSLMLTLLSIAFLRVLLGLHCFLQFPSNTEIYFQGDDPYFNKLIRILATRCMSQAVYFCSGELSPPEYHHYGLAAPLYTHFTSPIRRYAGSISYNSMLFTGSMCTIIQDPTLFLADVIVHRLLAASLGIFKLPPIFQDRGQLTSISDNLNYRHRNAQMAGRASVELHTLIYFRKRPTDTEARIVKIRSMDFLCLFPNLKGGGEWYIDEQQQRLKRWMVAFHTAFCSQSKFTWRCGAQPNRPKLQLSLI
ncbi:hypothetical protein Lal_00038282 [Lupinus albus]|nr:hypothetical protein Lal_00038282 [Lupinus albus]